MPDTALHGGNYGVAATSFPLLLAQVPSAPIKRMYLLELEPYWSSSYSRTHGDRGVCCVSQRGLVKRGPPALAPRTATMLPKWASIVPTPASWGRRSCCMGLSQGSSRASSCVGWVRPAWYGAGRSLSRYHARGTCLVSAGTSRTATATATQTGAAGSSCSIWLWQAGELCGSLLKC
jgi:hypothetical protein